MSSDSEKVIITETESKDLKQEQGKRVCLFLLKKIEELTTETVEKHTDDLVPFLDDLSFDEPELKKALLPALRHIVALGVIRDLAQQHLDNYFLTLNEKLCPMVDIPPEN